MLIPLSVAAFAWLIGRQLPKIPSPPREAARKRKKLPKIPSPPREAARKRKKLPKIPSPPREAPRTAAERKAPPPREATERKAPERKAPRKAIDPIKDFLEPKKEKALPDFSRLATDLAKIKPRKKRAGRHAKKATPPIKTPSLDSPAAIAARALRDAVISGGPLTKSQVAAWQRAIGGLDRDGVVGPLTRARVEDLLSLSVNWPAQIKTPTGSPVPASKALAAEDLHDYVTVYFGARPERIKAYQSALGLTPDGRVGPKTKAKVVELIGHPW